jgi:UDP-N-acetylmuramoyl-tripeptide--D-alanyl-D-alanine ligase
MYYNLLTMFFPLIRFWTGPLPKEEIHPDRQVKFFVHWFYHPLRRHLARIYVRILQNFFGLKVIGITGSYGKTTTKDMLFSILKWTGPTVATLDNITPTYNIPATIFRCLPKTRYLILEMGIEFLGDMDFYLWLVEPDIGILTSVNLTHTSFLGSKENVASEKTKLLSASPIAIYNSDDPSIPSIEHNQVYSFGSHSSDRVQILSTQITRDFKTQVKISLHNSIYDIVLPMTGTHFATPAAAAATAASLLEIHPSAILDGLEKFSPPPHRLTATTLKNGAILLDDAYNSSPGAVHAALNTLMELAVLLKKEPVLVFGQMNELGQYEESAHREIGDLIKNYKLKIKNFDLLCFGPATKFTVESAGFGQYFESLDQLTATLKKSLKPSQIILIKASRTFHFEDIVTSVSQ